MAVALGTACFGCLAMIAVRAERTGQLGYGLLVWNLFLAAMAFPLGWLVDALARRRHPIGALVAGGAWLLFFPNAPYLITDLIHLRRSAEVPFLFDAILFGAFAMTGMLLGFVSLYLVHVSVSRAYGTAWGWLVAMGSIGLGSYGIYLGRVERWNSWNIVTSPGALARSVSDHVSNPFSNVQAVVLTGAFALFLATGYLVIWAFIHVVRVDSRPMTPR